MERFHPETREALLEQGWRLIELPADLSLEALRRAGAPFKGDKFFREYAPDTVETRYPPHTPSEAAYRPGLMPHSLNQEFETDRLLLRLDDLLPPGARSGIASAAAYVWLFTEHHRRTGEWLLTNCFTFTMDRHHPERGTQPQTGVPIVVGVFGGARPILVSPLPEGRGRGVGLMPLILPASRTARALR